MTIRRAPLFLALLLPACMGEVPDGTHSDPPDGAPVVHPADAAPGAPDATVLPSTPDARPVTPPDAAPPPSYPAGPYGTAKGAIIRNLAWTGYRDSAADADSSPFNEAASTVELLEFFRGRDAGAKVIVLNESAGWCSGCVEAARDLPGLSATYGPRGARFVETLFEDYDGNPANAEFARAWGQAFSLTTPTVADPDDALGDYNGSGSVPMFLFVDADDMKIVEKVYGYDRAQLESLLAYYTQ